MISDSSASRMTVRVAGQTHSLQEVYARLVSYPRNTPVAFDYLGPGRPDILTAEEVRRTRKISSRISNAEVDFFVGAAVSAPWVDPGLDLGDADPDHQLFSDMTRLYWHFAESAPKGVNFAKISKVLHVKQPHLFPILDSHIKRSYAASARALRADFPELGWRRRTWVAVRNDLVDARSSGALGELRELIRGFEDSDANEQRRVRNLATLGDLRLLDILVW
jgi:hypothetical protein